MKRLEISKHKKIIGAIVAVVLMMATALGVTMAYYKDEANAVVNQFSIGNVTTELVEDFYQKTDTEFTKTPRVTNTGANDCYVRIRMQVTPESAMDNLEITGFNDSVWIPADDGWYYYNTVLEVGNTTSPLFTNVKIIDYEKWVDFDIILYQEAVQTVKDETGKVLTDSEIIRNAFAEYIKR